MVYALLSNSTDGQMDINCTQIQKHIFLASEMSCRQLLKQVMSHNNNWPETEEMSNYILHACNTIKFA